MRQIVAYGISSLALILASPAWAQTVETSTDDGARALDEVLVTARRREERLADIPAAGSVVDAQALADRGGLVTLQDLTSALPSVNFAATSTPQTAEISMRGSGTARATTAEAGVGLYRNGTYIGGGRLGGRTFTRMDFFDAERVEALRGVQSALYGRNAVGGAVNLISAQPVFGDNAGSFRARFGSKDRLEGQFVQNIAAGDNLAFRFGVDYLDQDRGFFYNPYQKKYFDAQSAEGFRGQVRFRTDRLNANLLAEHSLAHLPALMFQIYILPGTAGFPNGAMQPQYEYGWNGNSLAKQVQDNLTFSADYDLGFAQLSGVASYRRRDTSHAWDADGVDPDFLAQIRAGGGGLTTDAYQATFQFDATKSRYLEAHLSDKGGAPLKWLAGVEHVEIDSNAIYTSTRTATKAAPSPGSRAPSELDTRSDAVFGSLGYDLTDRFNVTGELRYTREEKSLKGDRFDLATGLSTGARYAIDAKSVEEHTSYTATASYKLPAIRGLVFAKIGSGFRAGGFNTDLGDSRAPKPVPAVFNAELSDAYEIGLKGRIMPRLFATLAAYQTDTDGVLIQDQNGCALSNPVCPTAATPFLRNGGKSRSRGVELELQGRFDVAGGVLRTSGAVSRLDAKLRSGPDAGKRVPQVPDWTASGSVNYLHRLVGSVDGFVNLQYTGRWGGVQEAEQTPDLVEYQTVDARLGVRYQRYEVALYANNATDLRYIVYSGPSSRRWNMPRTVGVDLTARW